MRQGWDDRHCASVSGISPVVAFFDGRRCGSIRRSEEIAAFAVLNRAAPPARASIGPDRAIVPLMKKPPEKTGEWSAAWPACVRDPPRGRVGSSPESEPRYGFRRAPLDCVYLLGVAL